MPHCLRSKWVFNDLVLQRKYCHFCMGNMSLGRWLGCAECACSISCQKRTVVYRIRSMLYTLSQSISDKKRAFQTGRVWGAVSRSSRHERRATQCMTSAREQTDWGWAWAGWSGGWDVKIPLSSQCSVFTSSQQQLVTSSTRERYSSPKPSAALD